MIRSTRSSRSYWTLYVLFSTMCFMHEPRDGYIKRDAIKCDRACPVYFDHWCSLHWPLERSTDQWINKTTMVNSTESSEDTREYNVNVEQTRNFQWPARLSVNLSQSDAINKDRLAKRTYPGLLKTYPGYIDQLYKTRLPLLQRSNETDPGVITYRVFHCTASWFLHHLSPLSGLPQSNHSCSLRLFIRGLN